MNDEERAEAIRRACVDILLAAHEEAGMAGLCAEGRFELAIDRLRATPIEELVQAARGRAPRS